MRTIRDIFTQTQKARHTHRQPKYRLFPPGSRLIRI
jgi:hypothetical protein